MKKPTPSNSQDLQIESGEFAYVRLEDLLARQEQAWNQGISITIEHLALDLHPSVDRHDALLAMICNEVVLREQSGQTPTLEEYQKRFPALAESLRIQWKIDRLLQADESQIHLARKSPLADRGANDTQSLSGTQTHSECDIEQRPQSVARFGRYELQREVGRVCGRIPSRDRYNRRGGR